jgi:hypothetical protein
MLRAFLHSCKLFLALSWKTIVGMPEGCKGKRLQRAVVMLGFLPTFTLLQGMHWLGFLCDELLFRGYHRVRVKAPLFVVGPPRSGTTFLHRVLSEDAQFTTFRTWECLFAPSITERRLWLAFSRVDGWLGRPVARLVHRLQQRLFARLDGIHAMTLTAPEEDYLALTPIFACFILVLPFPFAEFIWRMGTFDRDMTEDEKRLVMGYYRACLQKHLYVHGPDKRLLSKNASFSPLVGSLRATLPDCRIICCMRDPVEAVPSQLSSLRDGLALFGHDPRDPAFRDRLTEQLVFYYEHLLATLKTTPRQHHVFVPMSALQQSLLRTLSGIYHRLGIALSDEMIDYLGSAERSARQYRSSHRYTLADFGLDLETLTERFANVYRHFDFEDNRVVAGTAEPTLARRASPAPAPPRERAWACQ